ncbi:MAG TPA: diguanylate cyclase [Thermoanaerobaculia bacterium]|nr:diguanylate cyclase [Thermoanaerobaculia bacterium]
MNRRVLVVDDSEVTRAILARALRGAGFQVVEARDGAEGAMTALREQPAVVVTDLEMPTMDGFPLLRLLKADPATSHIPVLILTSHGEAASRYWSLRTGADAYLTKDHDPQHLVTTVIRLVEKAAALPRKRSGAETPDLSALGPVEVLARVARHLDSSLLRATVVNTLLEKGMAASDFHAAAQDGLEILGQVVDAPFLALAVAEVGSGLVQILLQDPIRAADVETLADLLVGTLSLAPDVPVEIRYAGERRGDVAVEIDRALWMPLPMREAEGVLAVMPRDPHGFDPGTEELVESLTRHLALVLDNARLSQRLHELSTIDGLTRQLNHRVIYDRLTEELERARRYRYPLSVVLCDLDHFKEVNDTYGHLAGDTVLREGAAVLRRCLRSTDILGRYGGEEFLAVLPQVDFESARQAAERLRVGLEGARIRLPSGGGELGVTASFGVASRDELPGPLTTDLLVSLADRRLYEAKAAGRNRIRP